MLKKRLATLHETHEVALIPSVLAHFLVTDTQRPVILERLKAELGALTFRIPGFEATNLWSLIQEVRIDDRFKQSLITLLCGILAEHQNKFDAHHATTTGAVWGEVGSHSLPATDHWVNNWRHISEELLHVFLLGSEKGMHASGPKKNDELALAAIASTLTDCRKDPGLKEVFCHHLNASDLLKELEPKLTDVGLTKSQINTLNDAILKHQFNPPFIMAMMFNFLTKDTELTSEEKVTKASIGNKIREPYQYLSDKKDQISLTASELKFLKEKIDNRFAGWFVPKKEGDPIALLVAQSDASQYPGAGIGKIVATLGPNTFIPFTDLWSAIWSVLGEGQQSSTGASQPLFTTEIEKRYYNRLIRNEIEVCKRAVLDVRERLETDRVYLAAIESLSDMAGLGTLDEKGQPRVIYLDINLEISNRAFTPEAERCFAAAARVRELFVEQFWVRHYEAVV